MPLTKLQYDSKRIALGEQIRALRKSRGVTGVTLAAQVGISQSKLSKIETGVLIPSTDDLKSILRLLHSSRSDSDRLIAWARSLRTEFRSWRFAHRKGLAAKQLEVAALESRATHIRAFQTTIIPGLLQIPDYARCILRLANITQQSDLDQAVSARIGRQQLLFESKRKFDFVISEAAALSRFCDPEVVIQQLDRIKLFVGLPNVRIGFIGKQQALARVPVNSFVIYDSHSVVFETMTGEFACVDQGDIKTYQEAFDSFAQVAAFGKDSDLLVNEWKQFLVSADKTSNVSCGYESSVYL